MAFVVDVFFAVGGDEDVLVGGQAEGLEDVAGLDLGQVLAEDFAHRGAGDVDVLFADAFGQEVAAAVFGVGQVDVADVVDDLAVDFLGDVLVEAAVAGLHVEDRDLEAFGGDGGEGTVGVA